MSMRDGTGPKAVVSSDKARSDHRFAAVGRERRAVDRRRVDLGYPGAVERRRGRDRRQTPGAHQVQGSLSDFVPFESVSEKDVFAKVEIRDPYFSLYDLRRLGSNVVQAKVRPQQPLMMELPPISGAEAGRHMAILGACSASFVNPSPGKHYYLAYHAELERVSRVSSNRDAPLLITSYAKLLPGASAVSWGLLQAADGADIYRLETRYRMVPQRVFERRFASQRKDLRRTTRSGAESGPFHAALRHNPYRDELPLVEKDLTRDSILMTLGPLKSEQCMGHFPQFPAMPKAVLMYGLSVVAGRLLAHRTGLRSPRFFVRKASVRSGQLAFAGEALQLRARYVKEMKRDHFFHCDARTLGGSVAGDMWLTLEMP